MKTLVILSHSWSPCLQLTCLYGKYELLCVPVCHSGVFLGEKTPPYLHSHLGWENFTGLFLSNTMKYGENDIEWQTIIQGMSLNDFGDYLRKTEGSF